MTTIAAEISSRKRIALVAHDNKKQDLLEWARYNRELLAKHDLLATGTTGKLLEEALHTPITKLLSGPLGGDLQIGAKIAEGQIDFVVLEKMSSAGKVLPLAFSWETEMAPCRLRSSPALAAGLLVWPLGTSTKMARMIWSPTPPSTLRFG